jgi:hypothetical protein
MNARVRVHAVIGADHAIEGRHVDDAAGAPLQHLLADNLATQEGPAEIDFENLMPVLEREVHEGRVVVRRLRFRGKGRVVHKDVYAPELLENPREQRLPRGLLCDVAGKPDRGHALLRGDLAGSLLADLRLQVGEHDTGA